MIRTRGAHARASILADAMLKDICVQCVLRACPEGVNACASAAPPPTLTRASAAAVREGGACMSVC